MGNDQSKGLSRRQLLGAGAVAGIAAGLGTPSAILTAQQVASGPIAGTGEELFSLPDAGEAVAFSPDSTRLVTMSRGEFKPGVEYNPGMRILEAKTGKLIQKMAGA